MISMALQKRLAQELVGQTSTHASGVDVTVRTLSFYDAKCIFVGHLATDGTTLTGAIGSLSPVVAMLTDSESGLSDADRSYLAAKWGESPLTIHELNAADDGV